MAQKSAESGQDWNKLQPAIAPSTEQVPVVPARQDFSQPDSGESDDAAVARVRVRSVGLGDRPRLLRLRAVLIATAVPVVVLMLATRVVASSGFMWLIYHRPGFPADSYGFSTEERMTYGSYGLSYILNFAPGSYLSRLRADDGTSLFLASEVRHMTDVKHVMLWFSVLALLMLILAVFSGRHLSRRAPGVVRKSVFTGCLITLGLLLVLAVVAVFGWDSFFTNFHRLFFPGGNWEFRLSDTLIRLYPPQFWVDAAVGIAAITTLVLALLLGFTWPTAYRRARDSSRVEEKAKMRQSLRDSLSAESEPL